MVRKKVDPRVKILIENNVKKNHRSFFVLVGDRGRDQVVNLHYILSKSRVAARPSVLWCYKKELGFSTHKQKRMRQLKRKKKSGLANADDSNENPFELFINSTNIRWIYYRDTTKILGQTFGMCILQDFEALTPNLLARTIETVEGGGIVCILLNTVSSLQQLYALSMDVHDRFRTEAHGDITARFNERFILSLADCESCMVCDEELNILPISNKVSKIKALPPSDGIILTKDMIELEEVKKSVEDTLPVGPLVSGAKTLDQAKAILTFIEAISEKTLRSIVTLTATISNQQLHLNRGRGKSAAIGFCLAGAIAYGYSNIFVTAPSPENLGTVFEFILKGFDLLKYTEHLDYEVLQSTNPNFGSAIVRINVFRDHRQTIQYIQPEDSNKLSHAELLAIDEAAAIPLPLVKALLGNYLVFMSSTVNGYEGTGRALSLKLIDQLRKQQGGAAAEAANIAAAAVHGSGRLKGEEKIHEQRWKASSEAAANAAMHGNNAGVGRILREISLETPIRYSQGDTLESWLLKLLCMDSKTGTHRLLMGTPAPADCDLYVVDRDALFSYHKLSESFLQRVMSLYTAAHYKNQPNDLQLLSDAPSHRLFVLLGPSAEKQGEKGQLPDILCVAQVSLEGEISKASVQQALSKGQRSSGDLIPWTISQQFQDFEFASLSGARIVRIATHFDVQSMGYGSRTLNLLLKYYQGELFSLDESSGSEEEEYDHDKSDNGSDANGIGDLIAEKLKPRKKLPPLLVPASQVKPERLHWVGASFGVTGHLLRFWQRSEMKLVYLRQTTNELTGEHTGIMLRSLKTTDLAEAPDSNWLSEFEIDCRKRIINLFAFEFKSFQTSTALALIDAGQLKHSRDEEGGTKYGRAEELSPEQLSYEFTPHDQKRLELYARSMVDYHLITDLLPQLSRLYFLGRLPQVSTSYLQAAILIGLGLRQRSVNDMVAELEIPSNQVLALFNKAIRKLCNALREIQEMGIEGEANSNLASKMRSISKAAEKMEMLPEALDKELEEGASAVLQDMKKKNENLHKSLNKSTYAIKGGDEVWNEALAKNSSLKGVQIKRKGAPKRVKGFVEDQRAHSTFHKKKKIKKTKK